MRNSLWLARFILLCVLGFTTPAAAIDIAGVDYTFFAKTKIQMQNGPSNVPGNVGVNDQGGLLRVGAANTIFGDAIADRMFFGTSAVVTGRCESNIFKGIDPTVVCLGPAASGPAALPITEWPPENVPQVDPFDSCVDIEHDFVVPVGASLPLTPGCYGDVRIRDGAILTLEPGDYSFRSLRIENEALLFGGGARVAVKGHVVTEPRVTIANVSITTPASRGVAIVVGIGSSLDGVSLAAPNGTVQIRRDVVLGCDATLPECPPNVSVVAERIVVGPITFVIP